MFTTILLLTSLHLLFYFFIFAQDLTAKTKKDEKLLLRVSVGAAPVATGCEQQIGER